MKIKHLTKYCIVALSLFLISISSADLKGQVIMTPAKVEHHHDENGGYIGMSCTICDPKGACSVLSCDPDID